MRPADGDGDGHADCDAGSVELVPEPGAAAAALAAALALSLLLLSRARRVVPALFAATLLGVAPNGTAALRSGDLLVTDGAAARVVRIGRSGLVETFSPPPGAANFLRNPAGIVVADDGPIYVADSSPSGGYVVVIDRDTGVQDVLGGAGFRAPDVGVRPWGIDVGPELLFPSLYSLSERGLHEVFLGLDNSLAVDLALAVPARNCRPRHGLRCVGGVDRGGPRRTLAGAASSSGDLLGR